MTSISNEPTALSVTPSIHQANLLIMQLMTARDPLDKVGVMQLKKTLERIFPDVMKKPSDVSLLTFYDFDEQFEKKDAVEMIQTLKVFLVSDITLVAI